MWRKLIFFVIVLSAVQVLGYGRQISRSYLYELARVMEAIMDPVSSCTSGCCVEIRHERGTTEKILLDIDESVPSPSDPCDLYECRESGLHRVKISHCEEIGICEPGSQLVKFEDSCCPQCYGPDFPCECTFSEWNNFGPCSVTCGNGLRVRRRRLISIDTGCGSVFCSGDLIQSKTCDRSPCPPDPCQCTCYGYMLCDEKYTTPEEFELNKTACRPDRSTCVCPPGSIKCGSVCIKKTERINNCNDCKVGDKNDLDDDGISDLCDNCITKHNPDQRDSNRNGIADACENTPLGK